MRMDDNIGRQAATNAIWNEIVTRRMNGDEPMDEHRAEAILAGLPPVVAAENTTGDNISRWATKRAFHAAVDDISAGYYSVYGVEEDDIDKIVDAIPPAEQRTGRWIEISSLGHSYKCSECGRLLVNITDGKNNVAKNYPYCHCGAKMEVGEGSGTNRVQAVKSL